MFRRSIPSRLFGLLVILTLTLTIVFAFCIALSVPAKMRLALSGAPVTTAEASDFDNGSEGSKDWVEAGLAGRQAVAIAEPATMTRTDTTGNLWQPTGATRLESTPELPFEPTAVIEQSRNAFQIDREGRPFIHQSSHEATFDAGQLQFTALIGSDGEFFNVNTGEVAADAVVATTPLILNVALAQITVGSQAIGLVDAPAYEVEGNIARAERGPDLVEEFVARDRYRTAVAVTKAA